MVDTEDIRGNNARIQVVIFRDFVLTLHDQPSAAVHMTLTRLEEDFWTEPEKNPTTPLFSHPIQPGSPPTEAAYRMVAPAWILHSLLDVDVDWMMPGSEYLVQEAEEVDQLVFIASSNEQSDVLRRISLARSRIHSLKQRIFSKQRLLMVLGSATTGQFIPPQVKVWLLLPTSHSTRFAPHSQQTVRYVAAPPYTLHTMRTPGLQLVIPHDLTFVGAGSVFAVRWIIGPRHLSKTIAELLPVDLSTGASTNCTVTTAHAPYHHTNPADKPQQHAGTRTKDARPCT